MPRRRTATDLGLNSSPGFYRSLQVESDGLQAQQFNSYPFAIPAVKQIVAEPLELDPRLTILVGENGSGKSTLIEAIAVAAGLNPEGGSKNFCFSTRRTDSVLGRHVTLKRGNRRERDGFFLRAECMYNVATTIEQLDREPGGPAIIDSYGGVSLHEQSHGESFFSILANRLFGDGFYVMDEPESALSPARQFYLLRQMKLLTETKNCQIVLATHSPLLMAYPGALLYNLSPTGITKTSFEDTEHFKITRDFLMNYKSYLRQMFDSSNAQQSPQRKARVRRSNPSEK